MEDPPYNSLIQKVLVPFTPGCDAEALMATAQMLVGRGSIILVGLVHVPFGESLSLGALSARQIRKYMHDLVYKEQVQLIERIHVSHDPWEEVMDAIDEEAPDLLLLNWPAQFDELQVTPAEVLVRPMCNIVLVRGPIPVRPNNTLVALRGSAYAEDLMRLSLNIAQHSGTKITSLHISKNKSGTEQDVYFKALAKVIDNLPKVEKVEIYAESPEEAIVAKAQGFDLVVVGATARFPYNTTPIGPVAEHVLENNSSGVLVLKTTRSPDSRDDMLGQNAISILVDRWFAENTYHAEEFSDLEYLLDLKEQQNLSISIALPTLNEEETVGNVICTLQDALMHQIPLVDEIVLVDSDSTDRTREIAAEQGVPVYIHQQLLPELGARPGKGEALWKSLLVTRGDILIWVDTDIVNIHPRFVYGLLGPLLANPDIQFVKGFYRRPLKVGQKIQAGGGGRVTELTARPLLNLFYPELSGIIQPLSGEYGGRRSALERLVFFSGYGVETGLLIDVFEKFGLGAIAQVDLLERIHHNQPLESLSKMSFAIIQTVIHKLEKRYGLGILEDVNKTMKLIRYEPGRLFLEVEEIAERARPPMNEVPEYTERQVT